MGSAAFTVKAPKRGPLLSLRKLAYINPTTRSAKFFELRTAEFDGAVGAATGWVYRWEAFEGFIEVDIASIIHGKGANASNRVTDELLRIFGFEHFCLGVKLCFELGVINACITCGND